MTLEKANQAIKSAWRVGIIVGAVTLVLILISVSRAEIPGYNAWGLIDVFLIFGLTFGVYKKNRACAIILFFYYVLSKISSWAVYESSAGLSMGGLLIFGYFFFQGIRGTFTYHKITTAGKRQEKKARDTGIQSSEKMQEMKESPSEGQVGPQDFQHCPKCEFKLNKEANFCRQRGFKIR